MIIRSNEEISTEKKWLEKTGERSVKMLTLSLIQSTCDSIMSFSVINPFYMQVEGGKMRIGKNTFLHSNIKSQHYKRDFSVRRIGLSHKLSSKLLIDS